MGSSRFDASDYAAYATTTKAKIATGGLKSTFKSTRMDPYLDPTKIAFRESCDSEANPLSTPIMLFSDVTGSMGHLAGEIITKTMGTIMQEVYERKPVSDPHLLIGAIGDVQARDRAPLQVTQFEVDLRLAEQMEKFYIEGGGGGNYGESYNLAWYFAANKVKADAFTKRHRKGYLFTIGDEPILPNLRPQDVLTVFGDHISETINNESLLEQVERDWHVFHLNVKVGSFDQSTWEALLGQHLIPVHDHNALGEVVVSTIQVTEGADITAVANSWSGDTSLVVANAIRGLTVGGKSSGGVVRL